MTAETTAIGPDRRAGFTLFGVVGRLGLVHDANRGRVTQHDGLEVREVVATGTRSKRTGSSWKGGDPVEYHCTCQGGGSA